MTVPKKPLLQIPTMTPEQRGFVDHGRRDAEQRHVAPHGAMERHGTPHDAAGRHEAPEGAAGRHEAPEGAMERHEAPHGAMERHTAPDDAAQRHVAPHGATERRGAPRGAGTAITFASGEEKRRVQVYLDEVTAERLAGWCRGNRYKVSEAIEEAVREFLRARGALR